MDDIRFHAGGSKPSIVSISAAWLLIPGLFIAGMCQAIATHAAEHASASTWFRQGMGLDPMREQEWAAFEAADAVYVVDPYDGNIRYFTVQRSTSTDESTGEIEPWVEASSGTGDPVIAASLRQAFQAIQQFVGEMESGIHIGELLELAERYGIETEDLRAPERDDESRFVCTRGRVMSEVRCTASS